MTLTVLLGGARSGKSSLAVDIGRRYDGPVWFVATAPAIDDDMEQRIERHRADRPAEWTTVEEPTDLAGVLGDADDQALVIVDCLTLWVSNLMFAGRSDEQVRDLATSVGELAAGRGAPVVAVTNEVGLGIHPDTELGRRYRDLLGRVNQVIAAAADTSLFLVAGRAIELTDPWHYLDDIRRPTTP
jgi:adenosyl cobinamide kinase/adenosyl cobinamide phosphate guanylyltransferase